MSNRQKEQIVKDEKGNKYVVDENEICEFNSKQYYCWVGDSMKKRSGWNQNGEMDFILDGKVRQCNMAEKDLASFFDSPDPNRMWAWGSSLHNFRLCHPLKK